MSPYISDAALFLFDTILGFYVLIVMLRFLLQLTKADFYNPISQFVVKVSNPPLAPMRRLVPNIFGIDLAVMILLVALEGLRLGLITTALGHSPHPIGLFLLSIGELLKLAIYIVIFSIFIRAILSWFGSGNNQPFSVLLKSFTDPILRPAQKIIPAATGLDLSPMIIFIGLMLLLKIFVQPLLDIGRELL